MLLHSYSRSEDIIYISDCSKIEKQKFQQIVAYDTDLHLMAMFVVNLQRPQIPENCPDKWKELMTKGWKAEPEV